MAATGMNEQVGLTIALWVFAILLLTRIFIWFRSGPRKPDPWDDSVNSTLENDETPRACIRCLTPQEDLATFCPHCGSAVGDYNNLMPWEMVFSEGEVFRNGLTLRVRQSVPLIAGYIIASTVAFGMMSPLMFFLPVYWFFFYRNISTRRADPPPLTPQVEQ